MMKDWKLGWGNDDWAYCATSIYKQIDEEYLMMQLAESGMASAIEQKGLTNPPQLNPGSQAGDDDIARGPGTSKPYRFGFLKVVFELFRTIKKQTFNNIDEIVLPNRKTDYLLWRSITTFVQEFLQLSFWAVLQDIEHYTTWSAW